MRSERELLAAASEGAGQTYTSNEVYCGKLLCDGPWNSIQNGHSTF